MTARSLPATAAAQSYRLALRASRAGVLAVLAGTAAAWLLRAQVGAAFAFVPAGAALAVVTGSLTALLHARAAVAPTDVPALARQSLQVAIAGGFVLQLAALAAGAGLLYASGVKFASLTAFALAFAGAALVFQVAAAASIARGLRDAIRNPASPHGCRP
jgi:hypothetical protein